MTGLITQHVMAYEHFAYPSSSWRAVHDGEGKQELKEKDRNMRDTSQNGRLCWSAVKGSSANVSDGEVAARFLLRRGGLPRAYFSSKRLKVEGGQLFICSAANPLGKSLPLFFPCLLRHRTIFDKIPRNDTDIDCDLSSEK